MISRTAAEQEVVVRGHSGHLAVPILLLPALAAIAFTYFRGALPDVCVENAGKVFAVVGLLTLGLAAAALFLRSRRVELGGGRLRYRSWITDRTVPVSAITAATFETELAGGAEQHLTEDHLTLWAGDEAVVSLSPRRWPESGLRRLLGALRRTQPAIRLDRAVERYLDA